MKHKQWSAQQLISLARQGEPQREIAETIGLVPGSVSGVLFQDKTLYQEWKVAKKLARQASRLQTSRGQQLAGLVAQAVTLRQMGQELGCTRQRVYQLLAKTPTLYEQWRFQRGIKRLKPTPRKASPRFCPLCGNTVLPPQIVYCSLACSHEREKEYYRVHARDKYREDAGARSHKQQYNQRPERKLAQAIIAKRWYSAHREWVSLYRSWHYYNRQGRVPPQHLLERMQREPKMHQHLREAGLLQVPA